MTAITPITKCLKDAKVDEIYTIGGWVKTRRDSKAGISFINLHDGSCFAPIQVVVPNTLENYEQDILKLTTGASILVTGKLVKSQGKGQNVELVADEITVTGFVDNPDTYPIQAKRHTLEFLREVGHLRVRTNTISAVTRIRSAVSYAIHKFFHDNGFYWIHTPIITGNDCEGAGELFRVSTLDLINLPKNADNKIDFSKDFFEKETFLTVSGQLNVEAFCLAMSKVYTFGPTFRAENSNTSRHLAEFWMIEPEIAFADLNDICILSQNLLQYLCKYVLDNYHDDMVFFDTYIEKGVIERLQHIVNTDFETMTYTHAIEKLEQSGKNFEFPVSWGMDLQSEHERYIAEELLKKPVIITDYPKDIKSFYMRINSDEKTVAAMDMLVPGIGEIIGGSQREERFDVLKNRMIDCNLNLEQYDWYLDLRRYGTVPHAGFGLGLERLISYITGLSNVRDVIAYPRTPGHANY